MGLGLHLGRVSDGLGRLLGVLGRFWDVQKRAFVKHWSKMGSKRPFGSILGGFGENLDASWENLGIQN